MNKAELIQSKIEEGKLSVNEARILLGLAPIPNAEVGVKPLRKLIDELKQPEPLITITLSDIDSVPMVYYKGEWIDRKLRVGFDWETRSIDKINRTYIHIEHVPADNKRFNTEIIQHNHPIVKEEVEFYYGDERLQNKTTT
ncbi:hypothetical protein [Bacillus cereus]|uniref:Uncharacterized protein n=1 Tax=Bacillus cereus TaxID=1396 RepID=A0A2B9E4L4_BACCE|nr:hypothetical protein [Bacillus cereus]PGM96010.1 hypothetical protein CN958_05220 [Bacillus cereus]